MRHPRLVLPLAAAFLVAAAPAGAQQGDTTAVPFRPGQWGSQFSFDGQFVSAGFLRFRSPTAAWVLDGGLSIERVSVEDDEVADDRDVANDAFFLQLGHRRYGPVAARVNSYRGFGVFGSAYRDEQPQFGGPQQLEQTGGQAGAYAELGATWMVTPHLGLGAGAQVNASYRWSEYRITAPFDGEQSQKATGWGIDVGRVRARVSFFF